MANAVLDWFRERGFICDREPVITDRVRYETCIRAFGGVSIGLSSLACYTYISPGSRLFDVKVDRYCSIGSDCLLGLSSHPVEHLTSSDFPRVDIFKVGYPSERGQTSETRIGHDVWIGTKAMITGGQTIGDGAVVGAGAVVTKDVPPYSIVAGVPAVVKKMRFSDSVIEALTASKWWNYDLVKATASGLKFDFSNPLKAVDEIKEAASNGSVLPIDSKWHVLQKNGSQYSHSLCEPEAASTAG